MENQLGSYRWFWKILAAMSLAMGFTPLFGLNLPVNLLKHGDAAPVGQAEFGGSMVPARDDKGNRILVIKIRGKENIVYLSVNAQDGSSSQVEFRGRSVGWSIFLSTTDNKIYDTVWDYDKKQFKFIEYDAATKMDRNLGNVPGDVKVSMAMSDNNIVYGVTRPDGVLFSYDKVRGQFQVHGSLLPNELGWEQYPYLAVDDQGWVYAVFAYEKTRIAVFDPITKTMKTIYSLNENTEAPAIYRGTDGKVYCRPNSKQSKYFRLYQGNPTEISSSEMGKKKGSLSTLGPLQWSDGSYFRNLDVQNKTVDIIDSNKTVRPIRFSYQNVAPLVYSLITGPDGNTYGSTGIPLRVFRFNPTTNILDNWGLNNYSGHVNQWVRLGDKLYGAVYSDGQLIEYDPSRPFNDRPLAKEIENTTYNPRVIHYSSDARDLYGRPYAALAHPDGRHILMGGNPSRGLVGGGILVHDVSSNEPSRIISRTLLDPLQGVYSMTAVPGGDVLIGTTIEAGTGATTPTGTEAYVYRLSSGTWTRNANLIKPQDWKPRGGLKAIDDLITGLDGRVYGLASPGPVFFVIDPNQATVVKSEIVTAYGRVVGIMAHRRMAVGPDGGIYVAFSTAIARFDPETLKHELYLKPNVNISNGFTISNGRFYFGHGSELFSIQAFDVEKPGIPGEMHGSVGSENLDLRWGAASDTGFNSQLKGYRVDISTEKAGGSHLPGWGNHFVGLVATCSVTGLSPNTTYYTWVRAEDGMRNISPPRSATFVTLPDRLAPGVPKVVNAQGLDQSIQLEWTKVEDHGGSQLSQYVVVVSTRADFSPGVVTFEKIDVGLATSTLITPLTFDTTYYVKVRAEDGAGNTSYSETVSRKTWKDTQAPLPPTDFTATGLEGKIKCNWTPAVDPGGSGIQSYFVYVSSLSEINSPILYAKSFSSATKSMTLSTSVFKAETNYYVRIQARDFAKNLSDFSGPVMITTLQDKTNPSAPGNVTLDVENQNLVLVWSASLDSGGSGLVGYRVDVSTDNAFGVYVPGWQSRDVGLVTSTPITGLMFETTYYARLKAFDGNGNESVLSTTASAKSGPFFDSFDQEVSGAIPSRWGIVQSLNCSISVSPQIRFGNSGQSAALVDDNTAGYGQMEFRAGRSLKKVYFRAQYLFRENNAFHYVLRGIDDAANFNFVIAHTNGKWRSFDGSQYQEFSGSAVSYVANKWYLVEVLANFETKKFNVWINGNQVGFNLTIPNSISSVSGFRMHPGPTSGIGAFWVDDVYISETESRPMSTGMTALLLNPPLAPVVVDGARAYPVPYQPGDGANGITFDRIPAETAVRIFTVDGRPVKTLLTDTQGSVLWDLTNDEGQPVASGVYVAIMEKNGGRKRLKVVVQK